MSQCFCWHQGDGLKWVIWIWWTYFICIQVYWHWAALHLNRYFWRLSFKILNKIIVTFCSSGECIWWNQRSLPNLPWQCLFQFIFHYLVWSNSQCCQAWHLWGDQNVRGFSNKDCSYIMSKLTSGQGNFYLIVYLLICF